MSTDIKFNVRTDVTTTREMFLRNARNKESFINLLTDSLRGAGFAVVKSTGDADVLIAKKAIEYASQGKVVTLQMILTFWCCCYITIAMD